MLAAYFEVERDDVYQFQVRSNCAIEIRIDEGRSIERCAETDGAAKWRFAPVALKQGFHRLELIGTSAKKPTLELRFGGRGCQSVDGQRFRHQVTR